jgi:hypothetical protein
MQINRAIILLETDRVKNDAACIVVVVCAE